MKSATGSLWALLIAVALATAGAVGFAPSAAAQEATEEDEFDEFLEMIAEPGPDHELLKALAGNWKTVGKVWADGPDQAPVSFQGATKRGWVLDGMFLQETTQNPGDGDVYKGMGVMGFNRLSQLYESVWLDNGSTGMTISHGRFNPATNSIELRGLEADPATGAVVMNRTVIKASGNDKHTLTTFVTEEDGREWKNLEITFTRQQ